MNKKVSNKDKSLLYESLTECIIKQYDVNQEIAGEAIKMSMMDEIIDTIGEFVFHDSIEYWAESVWCCYNRKINTVN